MPEHDATAMWRSRLRWRFAGAWQWPAFAVLTVLDAVVLARLPFSGGRSDLLGALLAAGLLNIIVVAVLPPLLGPRLHRRRADLPREVAGDRVGTAGLVALSVLLLVLGIAHRPALRANDRDAAWAISAATTFAAHRAPREYLPLHGSDTVQQGAGAFRTCFPGPDPRRDYCVWVMTDEDVPILRVDDNQTPNATMSGSDPAAR